MKSLGLAFVIILGIVCNAEGTYRSRLFVGGYGVGYGVRTFGYSGYSYGVAIAQPVYTYYQPVFVPQVQYAQPVLAPNCNCQSYNYDPQSTSYGAVYGNGVGYSSVGVGYSNIGVNYGVGYSNVGVGYSAGYANRVGVGYNYGVNNSVFVARSRFNPYVNVNNFRLNNAHHFSRGVNVLVNTNRVRAPFVSSTTVTRTRTRTTVR